MINRYQRLYIENYDLPINIGDTILFGKFMNKRGIVKSFSKNEHGQPIIILEGGKEIPMLKLRITNLMDKEV